MKSTSFLSGALGVALSFGNVVLAQDYATHGMFTEPNTGISFYTSVEADGTISGDGDMSTVSQGGFTFGMALPGNAATVDSHEYIGLIVGSLFNGSGWSGIVHGDNTGAGMPNHLMLLAWPTGAGNTIATSLRYSVSYQAPTDYKGSAKVTPLYSSVGAKSFTFVYRCQNCLVFDDPSQPSFNTSTSQGTFEQGWAQSTVSPADKTNPDSRVSQHNNGMGEFQITVSKAANAAYAKWAGISSTVPTSSASAAPTGNSTATVAAPTSTVAAASTSSVSATPTTFNGVPVPAATSYDYVVVGGGAAGIPIADKLSAAGHSVLLIEKGVASSARWGGTYRPESGWLDGYNLTWFDIPGECNRIWNGGSPGVACTDTDQMAGCILGGGTAVNAGLWWKPNPPDWDYNFPEGWKSEDMQEATDRVFSRIPGGDHPSMDGKLYVQSGYNIVSQGLASANWTSVTANNVPGQKDRTYAHTEYMYIGGERAGPMATYLVTANGRSNFHLWLNTSVERIHRTGGHATSLDVIATNDGGHVGTVHLTNTTGRVILAAGAFGTPKLLFRSGIGPADMLQQVQQSPDGPTFIKSSDWIDLPVGYNLADHLNTDCVISHPNISYYDWPAAWDTPITADKISYLTNRTGPLAQAAPDIGPMMWEVIKGPDGIDRQMQWTSRVEGSNGVPNGNSMTLSLYLGRGSVSRGRTTIGKSLNMVVNTLPYGDPNDLTAVGWAIDNMVNALKTIPNITINLPPPGVSGADYLKTIPLTYANVGARRANHWMGTAKMGTDDGRLADGTAVVDTNTKIYGTDNMFVVDASIWPGMPSTNPSALIVTAAEHASDLILALPYPKKSTIVKKGGQCSNTSYGAGWFGLWGWGAGVGGGGNSLTCDGGLTCKAVNYFYSVCM